MNEQKNLKPATEKQINFIKKLNPAFQDVESLDIKSASIMIKSLLKGQPTTTTGIKDLSNITFEEVDGWKEQKTTAAKKAYLSKLLKSYGLNSKITLSFKPWKEQIHIAIESKKAFVSALNAIVPTFGDSHYFKDFSTEILFRRFYLTAESANTINNLEQRKYYSVLNYFWGVYKNDQSTASEQDFGLAPDYKNLKNLLKESFVRADYYGDWRWKANIKFVENLNDTRTLCGETSRDLEEIAKLQPINDKQLALATQKAAQEEEKAKQWHKEQEEKRKVEEEESSKAKNEFQRKKELVEQNLTIEDCDSYFKNCYCCNYKNSTFKEVEEDFEKGNTQQTIIYAARKINFKTAEDLEFFKNNLMADWEVLTGFGGFRFVDKDTLQPYKIEEETYFKTVGEICTHNIEDLNITRVTSAVLIALNGVVQFAVDPEGHSYARYCVITPKDLEANEIKQTKTEVLPFPSFENCMTTEEKEKLASFQNDLELNNEITIYNFKKAKDYSKKFIEELEKFAKVDIEDGLSISLVKI